jgi:hypothetical protein
MTGPGFWLNPSNKKWVTVTRHEVSMRDPAALAALGVAPLVGKAAQQNPPYDREAVDQLRILGIRSGLIRVRDQGLYISVQFDAAVDAEAELLCFVRDFFETCELWRPFVRVGNLRTHIEQTLSWQEFLDRAAALPAQFND